jgi:hypothetical protein
MAIMLRQTEPTLAFSLYAFDHEMRLWKETNGNDWGAMVGNRTNKQVYYLYFEAEDLTMAKLHVCTTARGLAVMQWKDREFPENDAFLDSWRPLAMGESAVCMPA